MAFGVIEHRASKTEYPSPRLSHQSANPPGDVSQMCFRKRQAYRIAPSLWPMQGVQQSEARPDIGTKEVAALVKPASRRALVPEAGNTETPMISEPKMMTTMQTVSRKQNLILQEERPEKSTRSKARIKRLLLSPMTKNSAQSRLRRVSCDGRHCRSSHAAHIGEDTVARMGKRRGSEMMIFPAVHAR